MKADWLSPKIQGYLNLGVQADYKKHLQIKKSFYIKEGGISDMIVTGE